MRTAAPTIAAAVSLMTLFGVGSAWAQSEEEGTAAPPSAEASQSSPAGLRAIVRGLFVETRVGGGYMVVNADVEPYPPFYPDISGSEKLGGGTAASVAVGYDVTASVALQGIVGATFVSGNRRNKVRDLSMFYGGAAARVGLAVDDRLHVTIAPGVAYVSADNAVEDPDAGVAVLGDLGIEYFVHVRHISVGLNVSVFVPTSPMRAFVALTPALKYTF